MNLSKEDLERIESLAGACMRIQEICAIMELDEDEFKAEMANHASEVFKHHQKGYLQTKYEVNRKIIDLARAGSSPAQTSTIKLIQDKDLEYEE